MVYKNNREQVLLQKKREAEIKKSKEDKIEIEDVNYVSIKKYSDQIYKNNREQVLLQKKREEEMLKLKEKEIQRLETEILNNKNSHNLTDLSISNLFRTKWAEAFSYVTNLYNFKWVQLSSRIDYSILGKYGGRQIVNHYENHYAFSNKANMFINLMYYCENRNISVFKYVPFTIIFEFKPYEDISAKREVQKKYEENLENLEKFMSKVENFVNDYDIINTNYNERLFTEKSDNEEDITITNKRNINFEYSSYRDYFNKLKLIENVETIYDNNYDSYFRDKEMKNNLTKTIGSNTLIEIPDTHYNSKNMWVIKPLNLCRGKCIQIVNNFKQMSTVLNKYKNGVDYNFTEKEIDVNEKEEKEEKNKKYGRKVYNCDRIIIQKYIENPLLYKSRKCDIRIWVLITHQMKVYFFKEGHFKTCSIEYDINSKSAYNHITNYSFQKYNNNFEKFEIGNEVPFFEFQKFLDENYPDKNYKVYKDLTDKMKEIIIMTTRSIRYQINKNERNYQFEILGYDFMLDANFNLFLIEINDNPGIEESSPWIKIIVPRMLDDALRLTLDQLFSPGYDFSKIYNSEEKNINIKTVLKKLKHNIDPNSPITSEQIEENEKKTNNNDEKDKNIANNNNDDNDEKDKNILNNNNEGTNEIEKSPKLNLGDKKENERENKNKNEEYISPFPVPGYTDSENLWELVCDLNSRDPLDENLDKKGKRYNNGGIDFLINKMKNNNTSK